MITVVEGNAILCVGHMDSDEGAPNLIPMKFCTNTMGVSRLSMMMEDWNYISMNVHTSYIYAIGRKSHTQRLNSVEKYFSHKQ